MQHSITITKVLKATVNVEASSAEEAQRIGNWMLANEAIPFEQYIMTEGSVRTDRKENVIPFPIERIAQ